MSLFPREPPPDVVVPSAASASEEPRLLTRRDHGDPADEPLRNPAAANERRPAISTLSKRTSRFRWVRWPLRVLLALIVVAVTSVLWLGLSLRSDMRASLPKIDGDIHVSGLRAPVTVTRDAHGVPSINAATVDDLLFAQGYVTAQDRLWQMDALRRHASGNLAELLGPSLVPHDRTQRMLQMRVTAERDVALLQPDQRLQLEMYAAGVNAFIAQHGDTLPVEFHLLHYTPAPWTVTDSLLVSLAMFQDLSTEFPTKLARETLSAHLAPGLLPDLYPVGSWRDHPPGDTDPDLTSIKPEVKPTPLDDSQVKVDAPTITPQALQAAMAELPHESCSGCRSGSNNWAVAGARSASGMPLVSNDMHLNLAVPDIWYEASLHTADGQLNAAGFTLPGVPFIIAGHNAHVAWGFTSMMGDVQDVYIEHLRGSGAATEYARPDGSWARVALQHEHIRVRGGHDVDLDIQITSHDVGNTPMPTPILSPLLHGEKRTLSLAWAAYAAADIPFFAVDSASSGVALAKAFNHFTGPALNLVYGDDQGHIGFHIIGWIPIRGPAVQHIAAAAPAETGPSEPGAAPPDAAPATDEGEQQTGANTLSQQGHLLLTSFQRAQRRQALPTRKPAPAKPAPKEAATEAAPTPPRFTIGSPIPTVPIDALNPDGVWSGYVPYDALPAVVDPPSGLLSTANARVTPDGYPYALAIDWLAPYRNERIQHLLRGRTGLTPADMLRTEMDIHSEFDLTIAQRLAYAIDHASKNQLGHDPKRLHEAADLLRHWDGNVDADSAAPSIVNAAEAALWPMLLVPQIAAQDRLSPPSPDVAPLDIAALYQWGEQTFALERLIEHRPARWLPREYSSWNDLLTESVSRGLRERHAPANLAEWKWGHAHPVELSHPLLSGIPLAGFMLGTELGTGPRSTGGDGSTVKQTGRSFGPSERFTADLSGASAATGNITTGESGNPDSEWYLDQFPLWLGGRTLPLPLTAASTPHTLRLLP